MLCPACSQRFIVTILNHRQLTGIEHHADALIGEIKLLITTSTPWDLRHLVAEQVTQYHGLQRPSDDVSVLLNIDLADLGHLGSHHSLQPTL